MSKKEMILQIRQQTQKAKVKRSAGTADPTYLHELHGEAVFVFSCCHDAKILIIS